MNNIYVDELPKNCNECKLGYFYDCQYCFLRPDLAEKDEWCEKEKHCKLLPLSDRLAEERKKVVQEIREWCKDNFDYTKLPNELGCWVAVNREEFFNILDQIEKEKVK